MSLVDIPLTTSYTFYIIQLSTRDIARLSNFLTTEVGVVVGALKGGGGCCG
jgi:hypothetical protein